MGYWAELNEDNLVVQVIVADEQYIKTLPGVWVETDMEGIKTRNYAGRNHLYDKQSNGFKFCTWDLEYEIKDAKDENGKQLYKKKILGQNKKDIELVPLKRKEYYLVCRITKKRKKSKKAPEIIYPEE